ncbi:MAG: exodeoxyribonuclease VII small subunit [Campylobacteraceae bacterium]|nr:exodeoxyribonuclease VII small subunit [Campylobacteraceae bacterium]
MAQDFEQKLQEAKAILEQLNSPEITLEASVDAYKKGVKALKEATKMLEDAKLSIEETKS